jgi:hypothetical protein
MKTEEDEAFDDLARRQGGFQAKKAMAADKQEPAEWLTGCPTCGMDSGCDCDTGTWNPPQQEPFTPDWDAMAVMVEEMQRMAKRIEELEAILESQTARIVDLQTHIENLEGKL